MTPYACKGNLHPTAMLHDQPAPLKCGETRPIRCACTQEQFAPYCCVATSPFEVCLLLCFSQPSEVCPETAAPNCTTVVVVRIPNFSTYIIDGGLHRCMGLMVQDWTAAVVSFTIMTI